MKINLHSLRVRLSLLYVFFTLGSTAGLGLFSYWHLEGALSSSRKKTMDGREQRLVNYINSWPQSDRSLTLRDKLEQFSKAVAVSDTVQVYELDGRLLFSSPSPAIYKVPWPEQQCLERCYGIVRQGGHVIRTLNHVVMLDGQMVRLSLAGVTDEHFEVLQMLRDSYLIYCPLLLIASIAGGLAISHRALEPVSRIAGKARRIGIQDLHDRLPVPRTGDELQVLTEAWNDLLARLDTAVSRLTQFTSDISHDLRTSIAVMQNTGEFALRKKRAEEDYRNALTMIVDECHTTSRLLDDLLSAARADIVQQRIEWTSVDLGAAVQEVTEHLRARAETKSLALQTRLCSEAWCKGDPFMIRRLITILLDNAIKYTPGHGAVTVSVRPTGGCFELVVADTGIGIPAESLSRIFDRFYRVDQSRSRDDGSTGLGLAIAKWIVEAHRGEIQVAASLGLGSTFTVLLPSGPRETQEEATAEPPIPAVLGKQLRTRPTVSEGQT